MVTDACRVLLSGIVSAMMVCIIFLRLWCTAVQRLVTLGSSVTWWPLVSTVMKCLNGVLVVAFGGSRSEIRLVVRRCGLLSVCVVLGMLVVVVVKVSD